MGCLKLSYYEQRSTLAKEPVFLLKGREKNTSGEKNYKDYYAGGSIMPGRSMNPTSYRFGGAGGQEADDEITGGRTHYTAPGWEYDSRILRRWNVDPRFAQYPGQSPYACFNGNPILYNDPTGEGGEVTVNTVDKTITIKARLYVYSDGNVSDDQIKNSLSNMNLSKTSNVTLTELNYQGFATNDVNYKVTVNVDIEIISKEKAQEMQQDPSVNASNNFFEVRQNLPEGEGGMDVISPGGKGMNTGILTIDRLQGENQEGYLLEEVWHSIAGQSYRSEGKAVTHSPSREGMTNKGKGITGEDIRALERATNKDIPTKRRDNKASKFISGGKAERLVKQEDYERQKNQYE